MNLTDLHALFPLLVPAGAVILLMLLITLVRNHALTVIATLCGLAASLGAVFMASGAHPRRVTPLLQLDRLSDFYTGLIYAATIIVCALSYGYLKNKKTVREEYYLFLLTTALGCAVLVSSSHFVSVFIGIELISLSLYILISYPGGKLNIEAGIKYFVPTAVAAAFLLFGTALIYGAQGMLAFSSKSNFMDGSNDIHSLLFMAGVAMIIVGFSFKLALVPFHFWAPDVFQGASAPVAGFLGTVSKAAVFVLILRYFSMPDMAGRHVVWLIFTILAIGSMFFGNITALMQNNLKRLMAYSSIAHFGYLLILLIVHTPMASAAAAFYLTVYFITTLLAFGVITFLSTETVDFGALNDYRGLAYRYPVYAALLTTAMLSLAGIPLTGGFIAKFYLITAGAGTRHWTLLILLVINSVIGLFYYLRIVIHLYTRPTHDIPSETSPALVGNSFSCIGACGAAGVFILLIYLGIYPGTFIHFIQTIISR